jgi:hypothetical protein
MARGIIKLHDDEYVEWSTVVDAPVSYIMNRKDAISEWGEDRVLRADTHGTSYRDIPPTTAEEYVEYNRAGDNEECLTLDEIRRHYR